MGPGPPSATYFGASRYRTALSDPLQLEDILVRHPKLRVFVVRAGWPIRDRMIALTTTRRASCASIRPGLACSTGVAGPAVASGNLEPESRAGQFGCTRQQTAPWIALTVSVEPLLATENQPLPFWKLAFMSTPSGLLLNPTPPLTTV